MELAKAARSPDEVFAGVGLQESVYLPGWKSFRNAKAFDAVTVEPR
jgi:hypothetical protein